MQAAGAIAALARQHATDKTYRSPYTEEAMRQGYDLPWWEKITTASFEDGQVKLGTLRVRSSVSFLHCAGTSRRSDYLRA